MDFDRSACSGFPLFVDYHGLILGYFDNKQVLHITFPKSQYIYWFGNGKDMEKQCLQWYFQNFPKTSHYKKLIFKHSSI